jgi:hypothetical protein
MIFLELHVKFYTSEHNSSHMSQLIGFTGSLGIDPSGFPLILRIKHGLHLGYTCTGEKEIERGRPSGLVEELAMATVTVSQWREQRRWSRTPTLRMQ